MMILLYRRRRDILFSADAGADGLNHAADLFVGQHFVFARLVGVDDFAPQRQDRLVFAQAASFGTASGRITFHQIQLALLHIFADAVAQFAGQDHRQRVLLCVRAAEPWPCGPLRVLQQPTFPF